MIKFRKRAASWTLTAMLAAGIFPAATVAAAAATAHTTAPNAAVRCGFSTISSKSTRRFNPSAHKFFTSTIELRYNSCNRTVWAVEVGQASRDHLWVYNKNTHQTRTANYPHAITGAISDAGTRSHACMNNTSTNYLQMGRTCTAYK